MSGMHTSEQEQPVVWGRPLTFWTRLTLIWLMAITVTGAAVRLTGSGLGCTDWPTCNVNTELEAPAFHSAIEFGNRMISGLAIIPVIAAWMAARRLRRDLLPLLYLVVAGFIGQVVLGMLVTRTELDPRMVLGHFLLSIVLIFLGVLLDHKAEARSFSFSSGDSESVPWAQLRTHAASLVGLVSIIVVLGTLVTGSGPHTGSEESGEPIPRLGFDIFEITRAHSAMIWVFAAVLGWGLWRVRDTSDRHRRRLMRIFGLAAAQGVVGYLQYFTGVPVLLVAVHIAGSVILFADVVRYAADSAAWSRDVVSAPDVGPGQWAPAT